MADYENLLDSIDAVIRSNNRREITGQILQNTLHQMVASLGENYQLAGFATPTLDPSEPDQNVFYLTDEAGVYTNFDNITLGNGLSFLMWKNGAWSSKTMNIVTARWVDNNYVSKAFLRQMFRAYDEDGVEIFANDTTSIIDNIKAMCGLWTNQYLSALGLGADGGGGASTLAGLNDVQLDNLQDGQALVYDLDSFHWVNRTIQSGVDMSVVWAALAAATNEQINVSHLTTALSGYVTSTALATTLANYVTTTALASALADYAAQSWVETNYISKSFFNSLFQAEDSEGNAITPNNSGQTVIDRLKILVGAYTDQYLSALGLSEDAGASSYLYGLGDVQLDTQILAGGQALVYSASLGKWTNGEAGVNMVQVWTALATADATKQIDISHISNALSGYVTTSSLTSTLLGYVTTSALSTTLADYVTNTSLTTTLAAYGTKSWVESNYISKAFFNRMFRAFAPVAEGESEAAQVEPNDVTTEIDNIKAMFGLWTEYAISALGQGIDGSHAIGALDDLSDVTITSPVANQILKYDGTHWVNGAAPATYVLPQATDAALGGIKIGYSGTGKNYPIVLDNDGKAYVNVPWTDTTYDLSRYLPTTGGTLCNSTNDTPLIIKSVNTNAYICYKDSSDVVLGYIGVNSSKKPVFYDNAQRELALKADIPTNNNQLTNGAGYITSSALSGYATQTWVGDNYLQRSGGTLYNGSNDTPLYIKGAASGAYIGFKDNSANTLGFFGVNSSNKPIFFYGGGKELALKSDIPTNNNQLTNGAGYITGITSSMVTTALGYTPFSNAGGTITGDNGVTIKRTNGDTPLYLYGSTNDTYLGFYDKNNNPLGYYCVKSDHNPYFYYNGSAYKIWTESNFTPSNYLPLTGGTLTNTGNDVLTIRRNNSSSTATWIKFMLSSNTLGWLGISNTNGAMYSNGATDYKIWHEGNLTPSNYVLKTGDTMSGNLEMYKAGEIDIKMQNTAAGSELFYIGVSSAWYVWTSAYGSYIRCLNGNVGIRTSSPSYTLHVSGDIYATGGVTAASDERLKDIIADTELSVEQIANAPAKRFYWKRDHSLGEQVGSIAQYWQRVLPQSVSDKGDELGLQYGVAALISSITIARKVVNHEERIKALERENADLKQAYSFIKNAYDYLKMDYENLKLKIA